MKKIIYSLVIMIAASCLFTSCVETKVDEGRQELLKAKAAYLNALSNLRAADAEKVKAEAALEQAKAATEQAMAALKQAEVEAKKIANEAAQAQTDEAVAKAKANIENIKAQAEITAAENAKALAEAQASLDAALRKIAAAAFDLTAEEKTAVENATNAYKSAMSTYNTAYTAYVNASYALWDYQYDVQAGEYPTVESWEATIALAEKNIARREASIASWKEVKANYSAIAGVQKAIADSIEALAMETALAAADSVLVKSTEFAAAAPVYAARVAKYVKDSINDIPGAFYFGDYNKKGDKINRFYAVQSAGYDVYDLFTDFANYAEPLKKFNQDGDVVVNNTVARGFLFNKENTQKEVANILAGKVDTLGLNGIVSALKRDLVVVADSTYIKGAEAQKKVADKLKADYDSIRPLIEAGFTKDYKPCVDSTAKLVAAKAADSVAKAVVKAYADTVAMDSVKTKTDIKAAAKLFKEASADFVKAVNDINSRVGGFYGGVSQSDSAAFIAAAKKLGVAKAAYYGFQDSLKLISINSLGETTTTAVPFSELDAEGFALKVDPLDATKGTSLYGSFGWGRFANSTVAAYKSEAWYTINANKKATTNYLNDAFTAVATIALSQNKEALSAGYVEVFDKNGNKLDNSTCFSWGDVEAKQYAEAWPDYYKPEKSMGYEISDVTSYYTDTLEFYAVMVANAEGKGDAPSKAVFTEPIATDYATIAADQKKVDTAKAAQAKTAAAVAAAEQGVKNAKDVYVAMAKNFYGFKSMNATDSANVLKGGKLPYTVATFTEPFNCVHFSIGSLFTDAPEIVKDSTLSVIMDQIAPRCTYRIFKNDTLTLFAKTFAEYQKYVVMTSKKSIDEQLANIEEVVNAINADYTEAAEAAKEAEVVKAANYKKLIGEGKYAPVLNETLIVKGAWNLDGLQKEWADELAPNYPVAVSNARKVAAVNAAATTYYNGIKTSFDEAAALIAEAELGTTGATTTAQVIAYINGEIETLNSQIDALEATIANCKKAIAQIEAGYDAVTVTVNYLKAQVANAEVELADAEAKLAAAKATYEAVMAAYINK